MLNHRYQRLDGHKAHPGSVAKQQHCTTVGQPTQPPQKQCERPESSDYSNVCASGIASLSGSGCTFVSCLLLRLFLLLWLGLSLFLWASQVVFFRIRKPCVDFCLQCSLHLFKTRRLILVQVPKRKHFCHALIAEDNLGSEIWQVCDVRLHIRTLCAPASRKACQNGRAHTSTSICH